MDRPHSRKRPWLAALLSALAAGLGHAYLRRWWRAFGWAAAVVCVSALFVDTAVLAAVARGQSFDPLAVAPTILVGGLSVADAYVLARTQNAMRRVSRAQNGDRTHCPNCGKELDPELDFCQWCSAETDGPDADAPGERADRKR